MSWDEIAGRVMDACKARFGTSCTYATALAPTVSIAIVGIFKAASKRVSMKGGLQFSSVHPTLGIALSDLAEAPAQGDLVTVNGVEYVVVDHEPDGSGNTTLILQQ